MSAHSASAFFNEPTPLIPVAPRKIKRAQSTMTCPECDLSQAVALDCVGCGRIMKPSTDFRLADPLLAPPPSLESIEPVEAVAPSEKTEGGPSQAPGTFKIYDLDESPKEGVPWLKMLLSLLLCWVAWDLNDRLLGVEASLRAAADLPVWLEFGHSVIGREGMVAGFVFAAATLMIIAARQVLSGE